VNFNVFGWLLDSWWERRDLGRGGKGRNRGIFARGDKENK
jgi:hypothetical protein